MSALSLSITDPELVTHRNTPKGKKSGSGRYTFADVPGVRVRCHFHGRKLPVSGVIQYVDGVRTLVTNWGLHIKFTEENPYLIQFRVNGKFLTF